MTSLSQLVRTIRNANLIPVTQVNAGFTDGLQPPYISVQDFKYTWDRDTQNGVRVSTFTVLNVGISLDVAEDMAGKINDLLNDNYTATDQDIGILQESYEIGNTDPNNLYQYGVVQTYTLFEDPNL